MSFRERAGQVATETHPQPLRLPSLIGDFHRSCPCRFGGAIEHEKVGPSRDRKEAAPGLPLPDGRGSDFCYFHRR